MCVFVSLLIKWVKEMNQSFKIIYCIIYFTMYMNYSMDIHYKLCSDIHIKGSLLLLLQSDCYYIWCISLCSSRVSITDIEAIKQ